MNCWKSINLEKQYGKQWLKFISFTISLMTFLVLYVPFSIIHKTANLNETGIIILIIGIICLPILHAFAHIVPLLLMKKRVKFVNNNKNKLIPKITYCTSDYLSKKTSLAVAIAPTLLITLPGLITTFLIADYYVYTLFFTSIHIGITMVDFLYINQIVRAPKRSFIENDDNGFDILLEESS